MWCFVWICQWLNLSTPFPKWFMVGLFSLVNEQLSFLVLRSQSGYQKGITITCDRVAGSSISRNKSLSDALDRIGRRAVAYSCEWLIALLRCSCDRQRRWRSDQYWTVFVFHASADWVRYDIECSIRYTGFPLRKLFSMPFYTFGSDLSQIRQD